MSRHLPARTLYGIAPETFSDGSWIEHAPVKRMQRRNKGVEISTQGSIRAYAKCADGKFRLCRCSRSTKLFTIPASVRINKAWRTGFVLRLEGGLIFSEYPR